MGISMVSVVLLGNRHSRRAPVEAGWARRLPRCEGLEPFRKKMQIQINTDHNIEGSEARDQWASGVVASALGHHADQVTRVEVHLSDENAGKSGAEDKRCLMEARLVGRPPIAVTNHADSLDAAVNGAAHKLVRAIEHSIGRADKHAHDPRAMPDDEAQAEAPSVLPQ
jgi:ribosome-associated translation inhibitor RaiA